MLETLPETKVEKGKPPPLQNGDHLPASEFLRRYEAMPDVKKAELIEGIVYMGSPVRYASHGRPDALIHGWLAAYETATPGVEFVANTTAQLDIDNVPQPDALLRIVEECGGQSQIDVHDYLTGAPELIVEIAASTVSIDTREKLRAYRRNGVREYLLWLTEQRQIRCLSWIQGDYQLLAIGKDGVFRSAVFPGLWLDTKAALAQQRGAVPRRLNAGLKTRAHKAFLTRLSLIKSRRRKQP